MVVYDCNSSYFGEVGKLWSQSGPGKKTQDLICKTKGKRTGGVAEVVEHLPSKCEPLSSISKKGRAEQKHSQTFLMSAYFHGRVLACQQCQMSVNSSTEKNKHKQGVGLEVWLKV
jgi:hypothetical protein